MTAGIQVFNANGGLVLDVTSQSVRVLHAYFLNPNYSGPTGSFTDSRMNAGNVFYIYQGQAGPSYPNTFPAITVSGNTLSWDFTNSQGPLARPGPAYFTGVLTIGVYQ